MPALLGGANDRLLPVSSSGPPRHVPFAVDLALRRASSACWLAALMRGPWRPLPECCSSALGDYTTF
jgi:hypothetical protein